MNTVFVCKEDYFEFRIWYCAFNQFFQHNLPYAKFRNNSHKYVFITFSNDVIKGKRSVTPKQGQFAELVREFIERKFSEKFGSTTCLWPNIAV